MGCFLACFGSSKDRRKPRSQIKNKVLPRHQRHEIQKPLQSTLYIEQEIPAKPTNLISEVPCKLEEQLSLSTRKKVTFDTNVKAYEPVSVHESTESLPDNDKENEKQKGNISGKLSLSYSQSEDDSTTSSVRSYPPNHRYQSCRDSDDEADEFECEEQLSLSTRRKVTFDTNVKAYEPVSVHESTESLPDNDKDIEKRKWDSSGKSSLSYSQSEDDSTTSSVLSYPPNHRYQNCRDSDDEADEFECEESDLDDEDEELEDYGDYDEDEDEDSQIFVLTKSEESRTETLSGQVFMEEGGRKTGSNRYARDRSVYVHPVLNPVENLTQWKAVKSKGPPQPLNPRKENLKLEQEAPRISLSFKSKSDQPKRENQEIAVDASLSNWLVTSETTPTKRTRPIVALEHISHEQSISPRSNSAVSIEDRPILGALTVEEIKQFSASSSPRTSPNRSPDEMAIIGTVGTYWKHKEGGNDSGSFVASYKGIPNTTSKYREDKKVNWHSTPFETRLERALNRRRPAEA